MNAIVMAGGLGTRLRSVTGDTPKPMALLAGRPVLEHCLRLLRRCGVTRVCLTLRYRPERIRDYFGDGASLGLKLSYHVEDAPLGTAGGVRACSDFIGGRDVLVLSGDAVCDFDLRALIAAHLRRRPAATMALTSRSSPLRYGTVLTDRAGRVRAFAEKPDWPHVVSDLVNTGIYVLSPEAVAAIPPGVEYDFGRDLFPTLLAAGRPILGVPMEGYWCDVGTPRAYHQCNLDALDGRLRLEAGTVPEPDAPRPGAVREPEPKRAGTVSELPCASRARLMRALAGRLMEVGADFDARDGLTVRAGGARVRVSPSPERESLLLEAEGRDGALLREQCRDILRELEGSTIDN